MAWGNKSVYTEFNCRKNIWKLDITLPNPIKQSKDMSSWKHMSNTDRPLIDYFSPLVFVHRGGGGEGDRLNTKR